MNHFPTLILVDKALSWFNLVIKETCMSCWVTTMKKRHIPVAWARIATTTPFLPHGNGLLCQTNNYY
jgi:hypothetical protein